MNAISVLYSLKWVQTFAAHSVVYSKLEHLVPTIIRGHYRIIESHGPREGNTRHLSVVTCISKRVYQSGTSPINTKKEQLIIQ